MTGTVRPYNRDKDYKAIGQFLIDTYQPAGESGNWLQPRWEYMHFHPEFDESSSHRIGVWEDGAAGGNIVAVANYEMTLGEVFFQLHPDYSHLKEEMLDHAEHHLYASMDDGGGYLRAFISRHRSRVRGDHTPPWLPEARGVRPAGIDLHDTPPLP